MRCIVCRKASLKLNLRSEMKKSVILILLLISNFCVNAETQPGEQIQRAKFEIVKVTVEFLASDKETFKEAKEATCSNCTTYEELTSYVSRNKIKNADVLIKKWQTVKIDTTFANWEESLIKFKDLVITDISSGAKSKRQQLPTYLPYSKNIDSIINKVSISEPVSAVVKTPDAADSVASTQVVEETDEKTVKAPEQESYFDFLPTVSKNMYYAIIFLLLAIIGFLAWMISNKNKGLQDKISSLERKLAKVENTERQSKNISIDLKNASQKLKDAEKKIAILQEDLKAETERNQRLTAIPEVEKPIVENPVSSTNPVIKYARYADQGDGFSVQELLDEEDSETIFELTLLSPTSASFKISGNPSAQRYALSNSPYFLGKTSQYDTFPTGSSLINTDTPGELKFQGNKWLIVKPVKISFS